MSNIKTLVNQYFPSNLTHYETGIVRLPDHRPYAEKKKEFTGILCRHVNNGDGAVFTPNFEDEYLITYGTPIMGLHRWVLRELELFENWENIKDKIEETWKIKISDIPELFDLIPWLKVKIYEEYASNQFGGNEAYDIQSVSVDEKVGHKEDNIEMYNSCSIFNLTWDEIKDTIIEMNIYSGLNEQTYNKLYESSDKCICDKQITKEYHDYISVCFTPTTNLDIDPTTKMCMGYANLLKSIIKKYKKNIGPVVELPDIGVTLWNLPKKN